MKKDVRVISKDGKVGTSKGVVEKFGVSWILVSFDDSGCDALVMKSFLKELKKNRRPLYNHPVTTSLKVDKWRKKSSICFFRVFKLNACIIYGHKSLNIAIQTCQTSTSCCYKQSLIFQTSSSLDYCSEYGF